MLGVEHEPRWRRCRTVRQARVLRFGAVVVRTTARRLRETANAIVLARLRAD